MDRSGIHKPLSTADALGLRPGDEIRVGIGGYRQYRRAVVDGLPRSVEDRYVVVGYRLRRHDDNTTSRHFHAAVVGSSDEVLRGWSR